MLYLRQWRILESSRIICIVTEFWWQINVSIHRCEHQWAFYRSWHTFDDTCKDEQRWKGYCYLESDIKLHYAVLTLPHDGIQRKCKRFTVRTRISANVKHKHTQKKKKKILPTSTKARGSGAFVALWYNELGVICRLKARRRNAGTELRRETSGNEGCLPKILFLIRHSRFHELSVQNFHAVSLALCQPCCFAWKSPRCKELMGLEITTTHYTHKMGESRKMHLTSLNSWDSFKCRDKFLRMNQDLLCFTCKLFLW